MQRRRGSEGRGVQGLGQLGSFNTRDTLTLSLAVSIAPEQESNIHKQAAVGFYASVRPEAG